MPLKPLLNENRTFDPKAVAILLEAYDGVVAELGVPTIEEREGAARCMMQIALGQPDLEVARLRDETATFIRSESAAVRRSSLESLSSTE